MKARLFRFALGGLAAGADEEITVPDCVGPGILHSATVSVGSTLAAGDRADVKVATDQCIYPHDVTADIFSGVNPAGRYDLTRYVPRGTLVTIHVVRDATVATRVAVFTVAFEHGDAAEVADLSAMARDAAQSEAVKLVKAVRGGGRG